MLELVGESCLHSRLALVMRQVGWLETNNQTVLTD